MCTWITLTTMTFAKTFMISTIKCFSATGLTWWTISITTLIIKKFEIKFKKKKKISRHTLRLHGCFPHERKRVHFVSQRNSWQHGIDFSFKPHRHRFKMTCRHFKNKLNFNYCFSFLTDSQSSIWHRCKQRWRPQSSFRSHVSPHVGTSSEHGKFSYSKIQKKKRSSNSS
jgi:hypothetical protein